MGRLASIEDLEAYAPLNDPRLTDPRQPLAHQHAMSDVNGLTAALADLDGGGLTLVDLTAHAVDTTSVHGIADTSQLVVTSDPRLSNARTPTAHTHTVADTTGLQAALDSKAAASHTHTELPTPGQKNALAGTSGTPGATNQYVTTQDARLSDARTPTAHTHAQADVTGLAASLTGKQDTSAKGQVNGYASLGADGLVPATQLPAAAPGGSSAISLKELTGDYTNTTVTATDVTGLAIPIAANATVQAHYYLVADSAAATTGIQVAFTGPAGATVTIRWTYWLAATTPTYAHHTAFGTYIANTASLTTRTIWEAIIVVRNGATAGTIAPSVRSEVAGSAVNVRAGSWVFHH